MDEKRLIERLRQGRGTPPPAPAEEWFRVAKATVGAPARRAQAWLPWGLGLGLSLGLAGLWVLLPLAPPPSAAPAAALASPTKPEVVDDLAKDLEPLNADYGVPDGDMAAAPGDDMLSLLDAV